MFTYNLAESTWTQWKKQKFIKKKQTLSQLGFKRPKSYNQTELVEQIAVFNKIL
jgi:hypothetical protein